MQTLLFEDDAELAFVKREILSHCKINDPWSGWPHEGSPRYQKWIKMLDKISTAWRVPKWDDLRTLKDAHALKNAIRLDNLGLTPLP